MKFLSIENCVIERVTAAAPDTYTGETVNYVTVNYMGGTEQITLKGVDVARLPVGKTLPVIHFLNVSFRAFAKEGKAARFAIEARDFRVENGAAAK
jgi:hypothetical protein